MKNSTVRRVVPAAKGPSRPRDPATLTLHSGSAWLGPTDLHCFLLTFSSALHAQLCRTTYRWMPPHPGPLCLLYQCAFPTCTSVASSNVPSFGALWAKLEAFSGPPQLQCYNGSASASHLRLGAP